MAIFDYLLTPGGDLFLDTLCNPEKIEEDDAIIQISKQHLKLWLGNWFADLGYGTDWKLIFQNKGISRAAIVQIVSASLLQLPFVTEVVDVFTIVDKETRQAAMTYIFIADGREFKVTEEL